MKFFLILFSIAISTNVFGQKVIPFVDFNNFFKSFNNGFSRPISMQRIGEFKAGDNLVAYVDIRENLMVYDGDKPEMLTNLMNYEFEVSDFMVTWKIATTLNLWHAGLKKTLTYNNSRHWLSDSLVVFDDTQYGTMNAYYNGKVYPLYTMIGELDPPEFVGENIVAFRDNGNFYKVFWRGKIYDFDVWQSPFVFEGGTDMLAFNDPITGRFVVFEQGYFIDVEEFHSPSYKVGNGFVVYENQNGDLMKYGKRKKEMLSNFNADEYWVKDSVVVWTENGMTYANVGETKTMLANYYPDEIEIKNSTVVFKSQIGAIKVLRKGEIIELTQQSDTEFNIYGNSVLVELFNNSFIIYVDGKKYTL